MNLALVCVGAGRGSRFGGDKVAESLGRFTVLSAAVGALSRAYPSAPLVTVVAADRLDEWRGRLAADFPEARLVAGGDRRQESVRAGVEEARRIGADVVAIHDAARPLVDPEDVRAVVRGLDDADGAILVSRVADTVKSIATDGSVSGTLDRRALRLAQTPQVFRLHSLMTAWEASPPGVEWTDESGLLESMGMRVRTVVARHPNPKLTTRSDLRLLRCLGREAG